MGATFGKDLNTQMSSIKFGSTGRTVEFTPEESVDFDIFLKGVEATGRMKVQDDKKRQDRKPNPFHFYYINDDPKGARYNARLEANAVHATIVITELLDKMIQDISDAEITSEYDNIMHPVAEEINKFDNTGIGCGDTASDEEICRYLEEALSKIFDDHDVKAMAGEFWMLIHR